MCAHMRACAYSFCAGVFIWFLLYKKITNFPLGTCRLIPSILLPLGNQAADLNSIHQHTACQQKYSHVFCIVSLWEFTHTTRLELEILGTIVVGKVVQESLTENP